MWEIIGNGLIAFAYLILSSTLHGILVRAGGSLRVTGGTLRGAVLFISSCGITHLFLILTLFFPLLDGVAVVWCVWTAIVSLWTMNRLWRRRSMIIQALLDAHSLEKVVDAVK